MARSWQFYRDERVVGSDRRARRFASVVGGGPVPRSWGPGIGCMMSGNTFTYDSENHMTSMTSGSTAVTMVYDAFGNRRVPHSSTVLSWMSGIPRTSTVRFPSHHKHSRVPQSRAQRSRKPAPSLPKGLPSAAAEDPGNDNPFPALAHNYASPAHNEDREAHEGNAPGVEVASALPGLISQNLPDPHPLLITT